MWLCDEWGCKLYEVLTRSCTVTQRSCHRALRNDLVQFAHLVDDATVTSSSMKTHHVMCIVSSSHHQPFMATLLWANPTALSETKQKSLEILVLVSGVSEDMSMWPSLAAWSVAAKSACFFLFLSYFRYFLAYVISDYISGKLVISQIFCYRTTLVNMLVFLWEKTSFIM